MSGVFHIRELQGVFTTRLKSLCMCTGFPLAKWQEKMGQIKVDIAVMHLALHAHDNS